MTAPRSSQMEAVLRVMAGMEERTIAEKLADPNRPTWEQYKKDNKDKLNLSGMDQKKMEEYRTQLDNERDQRLARGSNHPKKRKNRQRETNDRYHDNNNNNDDSDDDSSDDRKRKRKSKKYKKTKKKRSKKYDDPSESDIDSSEEEAKHQKEKNKKSKKAIKHKVTKNKKEEDDRYRLSNFFTATGSESE